MDFIRKEIKFSEVDKDLIEYIEAQGIGYGPFIKQALREHKMMKELRVDYDRIRRIMEEVIDAKGVSIAGGESVVKAPKEVEKFFGIGKQL